MKNVLQYFLYELGVRDLPGEFAPLRQDRELDVVRECLVTDNALFLFPGAFCEISPHDAIFERFGSRSESSRNYFGFGLNFEDGSLRRALNGIIQLAPHLCRILDVEASGPELRDIDRSRDNFKRMIDRRVIDCATYDRISAILDLAEVYRSSILNAREIAYHGVPLHFSFDQASFATAREMRVADALADSNVRYFYDDFIELSSGLVDLFATHQLAQLRREPLIQRSLGFLKPINRRPS
jgi:hypothetical protein